MGLRFFSIPAAILACLALTASCAGPPRRLPSVPVGEILLKGGRIYRTLPVSWMTEAEVVFFATTSTQKFDQKFNATQAQGLLASLEMNLPQEPGGKPACAPIGSLKLSWQSPTEQSPETRTLALFCDGILEDTVSPETFYYATIDFNQAWIDSVSAPTPAPSPSPSP